MKAKFLLCITWGLYINLVLRAIFLKTAFLPSSYSEKMRWGLGRTMRTICGLFISKNGGYSSFSIQDLNFLTRHHFLIVALDTHCAKIVCVQSFSGQHCPAFGLNMKIQSKWGKTWTRKTRNTDFFPAGIFVMVQIKKSKCFYWCNNSGNARSPLNFCLFWKEK